MKEQGYLGKYASVEDAWKPSTSPETIDLAHATIDAIRNGKETSIPMLQSLLSLSAHPWALHLLTDGSLIEDCIQYLDEARRQDSRYPFGCEHGYLYFRIIVLAVSVSIILRRCDIYLFKIDDLLDSEDPTATLMALIVETTSEHMNSPSASPDSVLGWKSDGDTPPIIGQSYAVLLLCILWDDRKRFLVAWAYSDSPPLNGLLLIFWRCASIFSAPDLWRALCGIFWRYGLVAETENIRALGRLAADASKREPLFRKTAVDLEDARIILIIFAARMTPGSPLYRTPGLRTLVTIVPFAIPTAELYFGTEDLFIPALRGLFDHFWTFVAPGRGVVASVERAPTTGMAILTPICTMLDHLTKHMQDAGGFLNAIAELGFIEAVAQGIVLVTEDPVIERLNPRSDGPVLLCRTYMDLLLRMEASTYQKAFGNSFVEWLKSLQYLRLRILDTHTRDNPSAAENYWLELGDMLGYTTQVERAEALARRCTYTRCPDPDTRLGNGLFAHFASAYLHMEKLVSQEEMPFIVVAFPQYVSIFAANLHSFQYLEVKLVPAKISYGPGQNLAIGHHCIGQGVTSVPVPAPFDATLEFPMSQVPSAIDAMGQGIPHTVV